MIIITISEIEKALGGMQFGKAAEVCDIPSKLLKAGDNTILRELAAFKITGIPSKSLPTREKVFQQYFPFPVIISVKFRIYTNFLRKTSVLKIKP